MNFATVSGITLHYAVEGSSEGPPLVFINSLGTDLRIWDDVAARLGGIFRMVRYDKRGHGLSDCPPAPYTIRDHAIDLLQLLDHLDIEQVFLVGISVGGMIAMDFAAAWPERVQALILADTFPKIGTAELWNERISAIRKHGMAAMSDSILARWFSPAYPAKQPAAYRGYRNMLTRTPEDGYTGTCEAIRDADLTAAAQSIHVPTLVLCGEEDVSTPPDLVQGLCELIPKASYREIPGAGHLTCVDQPELVAAYMVEFL